MASGEARIVEEFARLLDKSKQMFNGLRELPPHGHKHWQAYFGRTFDVYTKLWKFQQQYRHVLDSKMGLKRWQIGEIASKIGQLYYHYYLRTSETNYLFESFAFYAAIRQRQYYNDIEIEKRADLMVKKLRYYARFIVVCLLLNRTKILDELLNEFAAEIDKFSRSYGPDEQLEWSLVIDELRSFLKADRCIEVMDANQQFVPLVHRLTPFSSTNPIVDQRNAQKQNPFGQMNFPNVNQHFRLQEAVIVGASHNQPRFSELTIDAYRMAQAIERQPDDGLIAASNSSRMYENSPVPLRRHGGNQNVSILQQHPQQQNPSLSSIRRENPHKYLIYRPTFAQLFNCISSAHRDVSSNGVLLVYLSSDAAGGLPSSPVNEQRPFSPGTWAMQESGHADSGTNVRPNSRPPKMSDIMGNSIHRNSKNNNDDADFHSGVATEVSENGSKPTVSTCGEHFSTLKSQYGQHSVDDPNYAVYFDTNSPHTAVDEMASPNLNRDNEKSQKASRKRSSKRRPEVLTSPTSSATLPNSGKDRNCLYPGDLYPFLRKPLMLVIDSENSSAFAHFPCLFGQPLVALLSPPQMPVVLAARRRESGGLFTLFLHSPLAAFCFVCGVRSMPVALWDRCQATVHKFLLATCRLFLQSHDDIDGSYIAMFSDDFLRSLILRFIFCYYVMTTHVTTTTPRMPTAEDEAFENKQPDQPVLMPVSVVPQYLPIACPQLPRERILKNNQLFGIIAELANSLSIIDQFPCLAALGANSPSTCHLSNSQNVPTDSPLPQTQLSTSSSPNSPMQLLQTKPMQDSNIVSLDQSSFFAMKQERQHRQKARSKSRPSSTQRTPRPLSACRPTTRVESVLSPSSAVSKESSSHNRAKAVASPTVMRSATAQSSYYENTS